MRLYLPLFSIRILLDQGLYLGNISFEYSGIVSEPFQKQWSE